VLLLHEIGDPGKPAATPDSNRKGRRKTRVVPVGNRRKTLKRSDNSITVQENVISSDVNTVDVSMEAIDDGSEMDSATTTSIDQVNGKYAEGMSACLLMKGDNHHLIEWIAYHYLTLPLRYLVIAVEPDSFSSPLSIIQRWNNTQLGMHIVLWNDHDFMDQQHLAFRLNEKIRVLSTCNLYHKSQGRTWVAHIDLDEFIVFNYVHDDDVEVHGAPENHSAKRESLPQIGQGTVLDVLKKQNSVWTKNGCMAMVRILFGPKEVEETEEEGAESDAAYSLESFSPTDRTSRQIQRATSVRDPHQFTTLRYFYHSGAGSKRINGLQKALIDVSLISNKLLENSFSIHRPIRRICPAAYFRGKSYHHSLFRVHHYLGSWDQYNAQLEYNADLSEYQEKSKLASVHGPNYDIRPWLQKFIEKVGTDDAEYLLNGVSDFRQSSQQYNSDPTCALLFFGIPRSFSNMVFPSIQQYLLDENPDCDVYVHSFDVSEEVGNRISEESGDIEVMELDAFKNYFENRSPSYHSILETDEAFQKVRNLEQFRRMFPRPSTWDYPISMDNMIRQWHSIEKAWSLMNIYEQQKKRKYDRVGFFRLDAKYTHPIRITTSETAVIPAMMYESSNKVSGINDSMFYGDRDVANIWATERFESVREYLSWQKKKGNIGKVHSEGLHPEEFLRYLLVEKWSIDITLRNICFKRVRTSGKVLRDCDVYGDSVSGDESVRGVVVLGMHRSGTSLLAGLLVHGLSFKSPGQLIAANSQNPYGFYENFNVARQNDRWLREQGKKWDRLNMYTSLTNSSLITNSFSPELSCATDVCKEFSLQSRDEKYFEHRDKALKHFNDPSNAPWIMKDPRLCVTFKMWLEILHGAPPAVIFTYRNPLEVARSLQGRSRETVELLGDGLKLWIWYNRLALENSRGLCRIITR